METEKGRNMAESPAEHGGSACPAGDFAPAAGPRPVRWERKQVQMGNSSVVLWKWVNASTEGAGLGVPDDRRLMGRQEAGSINPWGGPRGQAADGSQTLEALPIDHETGAATVPRLQVFSADVLCLFRPGRASVLFLPVCTVQQLSNYTCIPFPCASPAIHLDH